VGVEIGLIIEGQTEEAFLPHLRRFLETRLSGRMPKIHPFPQRGRIPKGEALACFVRDLLNRRRYNLQAVIALTDVYTGSRDFKDADDAKKKMADWVKDERFIPHAAQYEFEAWLLPYWDQIKKITGTNAACPGANPELINHDNPPSCRLNTVYRTARGEGYIKRRDVTKILEGKDLSNAADACPELKAFLNTILKLSGGEPLA
jgi:hypothetical protein